MPSRKQLKRNQAHDASMLQSCLICNLPDSGEMVSCDKCEQWFHFECVGVDSDVANRSWSCTDCMQALNPALQLPQRTTENVCEPPPVRATNTPVPSPRTPIPRPRSVQVRNTDTPTPLPRSPYTQAAPSSLTNNPQERAIEQEAPPETDFVSRLPIDLRIRYLEQQQAIEQKYLRRRFQLLMELPADANVINAEGTSENNLAGNVAGLLPVCNSSPVGASHIPPHPTHQGRNISPFIPIVQPSVQQGIPALLNAQQQNYSSFHASSSVRRPAASSFVPPPNNRRSSAPESSRVQVTQCAIPSAFAPFVGEPNSGPTEFYPSALH